MFTRMSHLQRHSQVTDYAYIRDASDVLDCGFNDEIGRPGG